MRLPISGLKIDNPAFPLLQAEISYWGITDAAGNAFGTTFVCADLDNWATYLGLAVKILDGPAGGQVRPLQAHAVGGIITVASAFTNAAGAAQQITAGIRFCILSATAGAGGVPPAPPPPTIGLWMFGVCDPAMVASAITIVCPNLAGFNNDIFNNEFWMQVIHNADAPGTAPEREIRRITNYVGATSTFTTDAFSAPVDANDLVCVFHESIMGIEILGFGTLTLSSTTVPEDNARPEANDYFNGCLLMPTEGACRFQPRRILDWTVGAGVPGTGVFTLDPNNPFTGLPDLVDYVIIGEQTEFVPAADGTNNITPSDVIGSKASTPVYTPDNVSDAIRYLKGLLNTLNMGTRPQPSFYEGWQDEAGIDLMVWSILTAGTGAVVRDVTEPPYLKVVLSGPANADTARLHSDQRWVCAPDTYGTDTILRRLVMEWEAKFDTVASIDNTRFFMGLGAAIASTRISSNLAGFYLDGDVLRIITDDGIGETTKPAGAPVLTNWHKYRIEVYAETIEFYVDETLVATNNTPENLPDTAMYLNFYLPQEAAANGGELHVAIVRVWTEDIPR